MVNIQLSHDANQVVMDYKKACGNGEVRAIDKLWECVYDTSNTIVFSIEYDMPGIAIYLWAGNEIVAGRHFCDKDDVDFIIYMYKESGYEVKQDGI